jgi:hypothetical protein
MPIPFRDQDDVEELGAAAFLRVEADPDRPGYRGALFQINARGEPVEFTYNRVATPNSFLWRPGDVRRAATKKLTATLLATCSSVPKVILCRADEIASELFCLDIRAAVPVCRVATALQTTGFSSLETPETLHRATDDPDGEELHLFWFPELLGDQAPARRLIRDLHLRGLLLEPFDRAGQGLREVFGEASDDEP